jgi:ubiquitin conjugation factor E4 B
MASILGPFFRFSPFGTDDPKLAEENFGMPSQRTRTNVDTVWHSYRLSLRNLHSMLHQITYLIIKSSPDAKEAMLTYFASVITRNEARAKMHIQDSKTVSSDGFMCNIYAVLLKLCDPIMDPAYSKLHLIDTEYLKVQKRFDISKLTKLNATPEEEKEYFDSSMEIDQ